MTENEFILNMKTAPDHPKWSDRYKILKGLEEMSVETEVFKYIIYEALEKGELQTKDFAEMLNYAEGVKRHVVCAKQDERRKAIYLNAYFKGYSDALEEMQAGQI